MNPGAVIITKFSIKYYIILVGYLQCEFFRLSMRAELL
jgi:hypothetical protein